jgi:hypothetical protein
MIQLGAKESIISCLLFFITVAVKDINDLFKIFSVSMIQLKAKKNLISYLFFDFITVAVNAATVVM